MPPQNSDYWNQARQARDKLVNQVLDHPEVSLIDIGYDVDPDGGETKEDIVLRVHVKRAMTLDSLGLPEKIDGIPIRLIRADYKLE